MGKRIGVGGTYRRIGVGAVSAYGRAYRRAGVGCKIAVYLSEQDLSRLALSTVQREALA
jgi:hypothetical protein